MTLITPNRLNDVQLGEIGRRLSTPLNDDGLRAWYRQDVDVLLQEVIALRRERAAVLAFLEHNPGLQDYAHQRDPVDLARHLADIWEQHQQGVWQRAEVKRIRDKLAEANQKQEAAERAVVTVQQVLADTRRKATMLLSEALGVLTE